MGWRACLAGLEPVEGRAAVADPRGTVRRVVEELRTIGLGHEFMNSQYEINLRHANVLRAADRAFRLKAAVRDIASRHGRAPALPLTRIHLDILGVGDE